MTAFNSKINTKSDVFAANRTEMLALVDAFHALKKRAEDASERRRPRFEERGQLTPRERLSRLLDPGMPFLELFGLANYMVDVDDRERAYPEPAASPVSALSAVSAV